jgi:hypothetical protein
MKSGEFEAWAVLKRRRSKRITLRSGVFDVDFVQPNTSTAHAGKCCVHFVIWAGCTSHCAPNSAGVLLPLSAAKASLALIAAP